MSCTVFGRIAKLEPSASGCDGAIVMSVELDCGAKFYGSGRDRTAAMINLRRSMARQPPVACQGCGMVLALKSVSAAYPARACICEEYDAPVAKEYIERILSRSD